jgi:hypothetical protein
MSIPGNLKMLGEIFKYLIRDYIHLKTMIHLFDHTVRPVLLYGSEIWRTFIGKKLREGKDNFISKLFSNLKQEHVHLKHYHIIILAFLCDQANES